MTNLEDICYSKTPIKTVILRVDFLGQEPSLQTRIDSNLASIIKKHFKIAEPRDVETRDLQITDHGINDRKHKIKEWVFHTERRTHSLTISSNYIYIVSNKYVRFEELQLRFNEIITALNLAYPNLTIAKRIGLRFINEIDLGIGLTKTDKHFIDESLVNIVRNAYDNNLTIRAIGINESRHDDVVLKVQYGILNPDYPSIIQSKLFVLDFDAYTISMTDKTEVSETILRCHNLIQTSFEKSITEEYRNTLGR